MARPCACNRPLAGRIIQRDRRDCPAAGIQQAGSALYLLNTCVISKQLLIHQNLNPSGRQASLPWGTPSLRPKHASTLQCFNAVFPPPHLTIFHAPENFLSTIPSYLGYTSLRQRHSRLPTTPALSGLSTYLILIRHFFSFPKRIFVHVGVTGVMP